MEKEKIIIFNKWKIFYRITLIVLFLLITIGCNSKPKSLPIKLMLSENKIELTMGNSQKINATILNDNNKNNNIIWISKDNEIATVDVNGNVKGLKCGKTLITVYYIGTDGKKYKNSCEVIVSLGNKNIALTNVHFISEELLISCGDEYNLLIEIEPYNGYINNIKYISSNPNVVSVDNNGRIKTLSSGKVKIRVEVNNGQFFDEFLVNVVDKLIKPTIIINPKSIEFYNNQINILEGETVKIPFEILPRDAYIADIMWESSDDSIVSVDNEGNVLGLDEGMAIISVKTRNKLTASIIVNVKPKIIPVKSITLLSPSKITMDVGDTNLIITNILPFNATNKEIIYSSNNKNIATVDNSGFIKALGSGETWIEVKTKDKGYTTYVFVTVNTKNDDINNKPSNNNGNSICGEKAQSLSASINGKKIAYDQKITMKVGETIRIKLKLPTKCGEIKKLSRTTADGEDGWRNYLKGYSDPFVDRSNPATFIKTDNYDWVIKAQSSTNGRYIILSQTSFQITSTFPEIKSFFRVKVKVI